VGRRSPAHTAAGGRGGSSQSLPNPGATTQQLKVLDQESVGNSLLLTLSAPANSHQTILLRINDPHAKLHIEGGEMPQSNNSSLRPLQVDFGAGEGYVEKTLKVTW